MHLSTAAIERLGSSMLSALVSKAELSAAALDCLQRAVLLLDDEGMVLLSNRMANGILQQQDGLLLHEGQLQFAHKQQGRLRQLLDQTHGVRAMRLSRPSGQPDLLLTVYPLSAANTPPVLLLAIDDPALDAEPNLDILSALFSLTPAQARLAAALLRGLTLAECASQMNLSLATIKAHLRELFQRTATRRQAELVRILSRALLFAV